MPDRGSSTLLRMLPLGMAAALLLCLFPPLKASRQRQARGQAIDELLASGALDDASGTSKDTITAELERMASTNDVESQLAAMKAEIGGAPAAPAIGTGSAAPADAEIVTEPEGQQQS